MHLIRRLAREEDGIALVLALALMMVLSVTTAGILTAGTANQQSTFASNEQRQAFAIAQEGLAYAEGMVYSAGVSGTSVPTGSQNLPTQAGGGSGTFYANTSDGKTWTLTGTGTVGGYTRTVTAQATPPSTTTVQETGVWNYIYSNSSASPVCGTDSWDTLAGGTTITVPILTRSGFCIVGGSKFQNPATGSAVTLNVGGKLTLLGGGSIGTSASGGKVASVEVSGSPSASACDNQGTSVTPGTGVCDGTHTDLWATTVGTTLAVAPGMPTVDFSGAYTAQAALPASGCPANLFDNDTTLNNSDGSIASVLFGNTSYDCKLGSTAQPCLSTQNVCELKWTAASKTLAMSGRFYFDGAINTTVKATYTGQASLYFTGQVEFSGGGTFCGIANCTTSWDPDVNGAIIVSDCWSNSTGSTLVDPKCVYVTGGSKVQFGTFATTNYTIDGGSSNMGPVLSNTFTLAGGASTLIPFHTFPPGTPLATETVTLPGTPPTNWAG